MKSREMASLKAGIDEAARTQAELMAAERKDALGALDKTAATRVGQNVLAALKTALASAHPSDIRALDRELRTMPQTIDPQETAEGRELRARATAKM